MTLKKRTLGKSGIPVSEIGLGLWAAGGDAWGPTDDAQVLRAIDVALDAGVTFFDTSDVYGDGHSEELLGKAMKGRRERFIVATKIGWRGFDGEKRRTAYGDVQKLTGTTNEWRLRVGDWRVIFAFDPPGSITVLAVALRRDAYRD